MGTQLANPPFECQLATNTQAKCGDHQAGLCLLASLAIGLGSQREQGVHGGRHGDVMGRTGLRLRSSWPWPLLLALHLAVCQVSDRWAQATRKPGAQRTDFGQNCVGSLCARSQRWLE